MKTFPIIEKLGGRAAIAPRLKRASKGGVRPVTVDTIRMWSARNSIPGYATRQLIVIAAFEGVSIEPDDFTACELQEIAA